MKLNPAQQLIAEFGILMENREALYEGHVTSIMVLAQTVRTHAPQRQPGVPHEHEHEHPRRACDIRAAYHTPPHAWEPRTEK